jgi:hypothetical protein
MSTGRGILRGSLCLALLALALLIAGCGGGSSSSSSSSSPGSSTSSSESSSGPEPSAQFQKHKNDKAIVKFGEEASAEEREAASAVVVESLKAREAADFKTQCDTLNMKGIKTVPKATNHSDCPAELKKLASPLSRTKEVRKDTLSGSIDALRVKGEEGYALYHGNDGKDYAVPLEKEGGTWKLSSVETKELI